MRDERGSAERRRPGQSGGHREGSGRPFARPSGPEPPLDTERARAELERFIDLAMREMQLELEREITVSGSADAGGEPAEIVVRFRGADEGCLQRHDFA